MSIATRIKALEAGRGGDPAAWPWRAIYQNVEGRCKCAALDGEGAEYRWSLDDLRAEFARRHWNLIRVQYVHGRPEGTGICAAASAPRVFSASAPREYTEAEIEEFSRTGRVPFNHGRAIATISPNKKGEEHHD